MKREQIIEILGTWDDYVLVETSMMILLMPSLPLIMNQSSESNFERENQYVTDEDIQAWALKE